MADPPLRRPQQAAAAKVAEALVRSRLAAARLRSPAAPRSSHDPDGSALAPSEAPSASEAITDQAITDQATERMESQIAPRAHGRRSGTIAEMERAQASTRATLRAAAGPDVADALTMAGALPPARPRLGRALAEAVAAAAAPPMVPLGAYGQVRAAERDERPGPAHTRRHMLVAPDTRAAPYRPDAVDESLPARTTRSTQSAREQSSDDIAAHRVRPAPSGGRADIARSIERRTRVMHHVAHGLSASAIAQIEGLSLRRVQRILDDEVEALARFADGQRAALARRLPAGLERSEEVLRRIAESDACTPAERIMATRAMTDVRRAMAKLAGLDADRGREQAAWYEAIAAADREDRKGRGSSAGRTLHARPEPAEPAEGAEGEPLLEGVEGEPCRKG